MPLTSSKDTLYRQWFILRNLPRRGTGVTARELRDKLSSDGVEVTKRTVERDLVALSLQFPLYSNDRGIPVGWRWADHAQLEFGRMDVLEALSVSLVGDVLESMLPPSLRKGFEKKVKVARELLDGMPTHPASGWKQIVRYVPPTFALQAPVLRTEILEVVEKALLEKRQIWAAYNSASSGVVEERIMHPLALIVHGLTSYLLATQGKDTVSKQYPLHRFEKVEKLEEPAWRPSSFSLDQMKSDGHLDFGKGKKIGLQAILSEDLARILTETPMSQDQVITRRSGVIRLKANVRYSWQLVFYLLSQSMSLEVLKPQSLRKEIAAILKSASVKYA